MPNMDTKNMIEKIFCNLDDWRNLPKYQLERRADNIIAYILPKKVSVKTVSEEL